MSVEDMNDIVRSSPIEQSTIPEDIYERDFIL